MKSMLAMMSVCHSSLPLFFTAVFCVIDIFFFLNLRLLISYIYGAPSKARNANVVYIWTYVWQR